MGEIGYTVGNYYTRKRSAADKRTYKTCYSVGDINAPKASTAFKCTDHVGYTGGDIDACDARTAAKCAVNIGYCLGNFNACKRRAAVKRTGNTCYTVRNIDARKARAVHKCISKEGYAVRNFNLRKICTVPKRIAYPCYSAVGNFQLAGKSGSYISVCIRQGLLTVSKRNCIHKLVFSTAILKSARIYYDYAVGQVYFLKRRRTVKGVLAYKAYIARHGDLFQAFWHICFVSLGCTCAKDIAYPSVLVGSVA